MKNEVKEGEQMEERKKKKRGQQRPPTGGTAVLVGVAAAAAAAVEWKVASNVQAKALIVQPFTPRHG